MRKPWWSWRDTFARLGYVVEWRPAKRRSHRPTSRPRSLSIEALEARQLLSVVPTPTIAGPFTVEAGDMVRMHATGTGVTHYLWDLDNDGICGETGTANAKQGNELGSDPFFSSTGLAPGDYTVRLKAEDALGSQSAAVTSVVHVVSAPPKATLAGSTLIDEGSDYVLSLSAKGTEGTVSWDIDWGDSPTHGSASGTSTEVSHSYADGPTLNSIVGSMTDANGSHPVYDAAQMPGELVSNFGTDGRISLTLQLYGEDLPITVVDAVTQHTTYYGDFTIVVGYCDTGGGDNDFVIAQLNPDGTQVYGFGNTYSGATVLDFGGDDTPTAVTVSADGKIIVAGYTHVSGTNYDFAVAQLDEFGWPDWTSTIDFASGSDDRAYAVSLQNDAVLLGGSSGGNYALARLDAYGVLDSSFNGSGKLTTAFSGTSSVTGLAISDGCIYAGGSTAGDFALARYRATDGLLLGTTTTDFLGGVDAATCIGVDSSSRVVLGGYSDTGENNYDFALARYTSGGSLDATFAAGVDGGLSGGGRVITDLGSLSDRASDLLIQADGKLLLGGYSDRTDDNFALMRYNADGSRDPYFAAYGKTFTDFGGADSVAALLLDGDDLLTVGSADSANAGSVGLVRYHLGQSQQLTVQVANVAPLVHIDTVQRTGRSVTVSGSFRDPGNDTCSGTVYYGDGNDAPVSFTGNTFTITHTYNDPGTYSFYMEVTDGSAVGSTQCYINVSVPKSWTGDGNDGLWSNALNWSGHTLPTSSDFVKLDVPGTQTITVDSAAAAGELYCAENLQLAVGAFTVGHLTVYGDARFIGPSTSTMVAADTTLELLGPWCNSRSMTVAAGGTIVLGNTFATTDVETVTLGSGANLVLLGTLDNSGDTLALGAGTNVSLLGTIVGGVVDSGATGATLNIGGGTLDGVTLAGDATVNSYSLTVRNGLKLLGTATVLSGIGFDGDQSVTGTGSIVLENGGIYFSGIASTGTAIVGPNVTIAGWGNIGGTSGYRLVNQGTLKAESTQSNRTLVISIPVENAGVLSAAGSTTLNLDGAATDSLLRGVAQVLSGTELSVAWYGLGRDIEGYKPVAGYGFEREPESCRLEASTDGTTYYPLMVGSGADCSAIVSGLRYNTTYRLRMVATYGNGGERVYDAGAVTTANVRGSPGWYRIVAITETGGDPLASSGTSSARIGSVQLPSASMTTMGAHESWVHSIGVAGSGEPVGTFSNDGLWICAESPQAAILESLRGLVRDGSLPQVGPSGKFKVYRIQDFNASDELEWEMYSFDSSARPPAGGYSRIVTTDYTVDMDVEEIDRTECDNPCGCDDGGCGAQSGTSGGSTMPTNAITSTGGAAACGFDAGGLTYSSRETSLDYGYGPGWSDSDELPALTVSRVTMAVRLGSERSVWFDEAGGGTYAARYGATQTLVHDVSNHLFVFTEADGTRYEFYDVADVGGAHNPEGGLKRVVDPTGVATITVTAWTTVAGGEVVDGRIETVEYRTPAGTAYQKRTFAYELVHNGSEDLVRIGSVTLQENHATGSPSWNDVRQLGYSYYVSGEDYGSVGDLKSIVTKTKVGGNWVDGDTNYFRYYKAGELYGFEHGLKRVVLANSYAKLSTDTSGHPEDATETRQVGSKYIGDYTCFYYKYDSDRRVSEKVVFGESDSSDIVVSLSDNAPGYNNWSRKSVETKADAHDRVLWTTTVYTNYVGATLLQDLYDASSGNHTITYNRYDDNGRLVLTAEPSAVDTYAKVNDDWDQGAPNSIVFTPDGLVHETVYYDSTDVPIDGDTAGGVDGYVAYQLSRLSDSDPTRVFETVADVTTWLSSPDANTALLSHTDYFARWTSAAATYQDAVAAADRIVYVAANETTYSNADGTGAAITSYAYSWHPDTFQVKERRTTLPPVDTTQNGSGTPATTFAYYNSAGQLEWFADANGRFTRNQYDPVTGWLTRTIQDADALDGSLSGLGLTFVGSGTPYWPSLPGSGQGASEKTDYQYDALGRVTQTLGPIYQDDAGHWVRTATWTVYKDAAHETWTVQGYATYSDATGSTRTDWTMVNPMFIRKTDRDGRVTDQIEAQLGDTITLSLTDPLTDISSFALDSSSLHFKAWRASNYSKTRLIATAVYSDLSTVDVSVLRNAVDGSFRGTKSVNYSETGYAYENYDDVNTMGRQNKTVSPGGTITRVVYDARGNVLETWVGTNDNGATDTDPHGGGATGNNMVRISANEYDGGLSGGDGNLTKVTQYLDDTNPQIHCREAGYRYDWRDRLEYILSPLPPSVPQYDGTYYTFMKYSYDNLGRTIEAAQYWDYDENGPGGTDVLQSRVVTSYDSLGRVYETDQYAYSGSTECGPLTALTWYDPAGRVIKSVAAGQQTFTKTAYDGLGRVTGQWIGYDTDESIYDEAGNRVGDSIFKATEYNYDGAGNVILTTTREHVDDVEDNIHGIDAGVDRTEAYAFQDENSDWLFTGGLLERDGHEYSTEGGPLGLHEVTSGICYVMYAPTPAGRFAGRPAGVAEHFVVVQYDGGWQYSDGTTGWNNFTPQSGDLLIVKLDFDSWTTWVMDKTRDSFTGAWYDGVGRQIAIGNWGTNDGCEVTTENRSASPPQHSIYLTMQLTSYEYDASGRLYKTIDPAGREGRTSYDAAGRVTKTIQNYEDGVVEYGEPVKDVTVDTTYTADGKVATVTAKNMITGDQTTTYVYGTTLDDSGVASSQLLRAIIYPDSADSTDRVQYCYNTLGEQVQMTDQNGTTHQYEYDKLGRPTEDRVTNLGNDNLDSSIQRISRTYNSRGLPEYVRSYSLPSGGMLCNYVQYAYNAFGLMTREYEWHGGESTVPYELSYYDADHGLRLASMSYPDGRIVHYTYGEEGSADDVLNRVQAIYDDDGYGNPTQALASYRYLGLNTVVTEDYEEAQVKLDYAGYSGGDPGTYSGLDRFGRVVDQFWEKYGEEETSFDEFVYGYDQAGNRTSRENWVSSGNLDPAVYLDELYTYDAMNQLVTLTRGQLNGWYIEPGTDVFSEEWWEDATGNLEMYYQTKDHETTYGENYTHNEANELTAVDGYTNRTAHDRNGNMTVMPKPSAPGTTATISCKYDAWNRLVEVHDGNSLVARYEYDGLGRRIVEAVDSQSPGSPNGVDKYVHVYYSGQQVIETRETTNPSATPDQLPARYQYVWSPRYVDSLICRDENKNADSHCNGTGDQRLYYLNDANYNVTSLVGKVAVEGGYDWQVVERYLYSAYGMVTVLAADFTPVTGNQSAFGNTILYTGKEFDRATGLYYYNARYYDPALARFINRDPLMYSDGFNLYEYVKDGPTNATDPTGMSTSADFVSALLGYLTPRAGIKQDFRVCTRVAASVCVCGIVRVEDELRHCCRNGQRTLCNIFRFDVSVGVYECTSLGGTGFLTPQFPAFKMTFSPAKKRPLSGIAGFGNTSCPQDGWDGSVCITASAGFSAWTYGARACYNFGAKTTTIDAGFGIGTGTGVAGSGSGTYTTCGLL